MSHGEIQLIAVGTPTDWRIVINEFTVPVGTVGTKF